MSDDVKRAIAELEGLVVCRCSPAYTDRQLHDPDCHCGYAPDVGAVADHIQELESDLSFMKACHGELAHQYKELEAKMAKAIKALNEIKRYSPCNDSQRKAMETLSEIEVKKNE
jgi:hypothetical protein